MITRGEAEEIAARWARGEADQRGYGCEPALAEFDLGWVIWTRPAPDVLPVPGDGARTVIDRETGVLSTWPAIPPDDIATLYRERRPRPSATIDAWATLRRSARRRPSPATVAELVVDGRLFRAQGAKGDQTIGHHPLVEGRLGTMPVSSRVRGAERHAELIAVSDALHEVGPDGLRAGVGQDDDLRAGVGQDGGLRGGAGREGLRGGLGLDGGRRRTGFGAFLVRDQGDPDAGAPVRPCETCLAVLVDLGLLPRSELGYAAEWHHGVDGPAGRFPPEVSRVLAGGGWLGVELPLAAAIEEAERLSGLPAFPAARRALTEFAGVRCGRRGPGRRRAIRLLTFDPLPAARQHRALVELAEVLGVPVFPLAVEGGDALVVIDERSRVFILDQAGDWFVGETLDEAVIGLLTGNGPADRLHDDGTWP